MEISKAVLVLLSANLCCSPLSAKSEASAHEVRSGRAEIQPQAQADPLTEQFMDLRRSLAQSRRQMLEKSTGPDAAARMEQLRNWRAAHAAQHEQVRDLARQLSERNAAERPERDLPTLEQYQSRIPQDASPALRELMEEQFAMRQARRQTGVEARGISVDERLSRMRAFQKANQSRMSRIRQLSGEISAESRQAKSQRPSPTLEQYLSRLPEDATPAMREFMEERYHLQAARRAHALEDSDLSDEMRRARHDQFREQQAVRLERVRQLSKEIANERKLQ